MKRFLTIALTGLLGMASSQGGTITGKVHAEGKTTEQDVQCTVYDSKAFKFAPKVNYSEMHDFVVNIEGTVGTNKPVAPDKPVQIITTRKVTQKKATFTPHILPIVVGTTVEWPNNDDIYHNVFSYSEVKPFDLGLYKNPELKSVTFDKPGRVDVFCSIHSSMSCTVLIFENPYFAPTDAEGNFVITNIPPGTYKLRAWHERLPSQIKEITVPENGEVKVNFTLGITGLPKY